MRTPVAVATGALLFASLLGSLSALALTSDSTQSIGAELPIQDGSIEFVGHASPGALVTFEKDAAVIGTQVADSDGAYDLTFSGQTLGSATYGLYAIDGSGRTTDTLSANVTILPGVTTVFGDYLLSPTLRVVTDPLKRPQTQHIVGSTQPTSTVTTFFSGSKYGDNTSSQGGADAAGNYNNTPSQTLHLGSYAVSALAQSGGGQQSAQTTPQNFTVVLSADLNNDNRVNLTDFSILMFYYGQSGLNKPADINDDTRANLTDLSIMLFYWTG